VSFIIFAAALARAAFAPTSRKCVYTALAPNRFKDFWRE
jgi:hypothetical protein